MDKEALRDQILTRLKSDYALLLQAAKTAHAAAIHEESIPDNKICNFRPGGRLILLRARPIALRKFSRAIQEYQQLSLPQFFR